MGIRTPTNYKDKNEAYPYHIHIEPSKGWVSLRLRDIWHYRELLYFLTWRDIKVRYKQTALGATWAIIQPVMTMIVFTIFFGKLVGTNTGDIPYPIFSYVGLLPWNYFSQSVTQSSNSLVGNANLLTKIYFPRLVVPFSGVLSGIIDFALAFIVLIGMMIYYHVELTWKAALMPLFLFLSVATALGVGLWLSAFNVEYRDVRYVVPFLTQFWLFATPVAYPSTLLSEPWLTLYGLNPMVGVVEGFRWSLLNASIDPTMLALSIAVSLILLVSGAFYFRRMEKTFADVV